MLTAAADLPATPYPGPAAAIGSPANGCLAGGVAMPLSGPGWEVLRPARNRFWGHPALIAFLRDMAARTHDLGTLLLGDLAQPRGGRLPWGHASHQTGIDVDIFYLSPGPISESERATPYLPSFLDRPDHLDPARWTSRQVALLRAFASDTRVERIFVNPVIKRELCRHAQPEDAVWLRHIRPWWGHDDHFHVRLVCPQEDEACQAGPPIPEGNGCGAELDAWFTPPSTPAVPAVPSAKPPPPAACQMIWKASP